MSMHGWQRDNKHNHSLQCSGLGRRHQQGNNGNVLVLVYQGHKLLQGVQ